MKKTCRNHPTGLITALILLSAYLLAACKPSTANPATVTARAQRVIAQATDVALQMRETTLLDEKQATATAQDHLERLARVSTWPIVLSDTFDDNVNEWIVGQQTSEYADASFTIANGVYHWAATSHQGFIWWNRPTIPTVTDFYVSVDFRQISGPLGAYVGLKMRLDEAGNYYLFSLRSLGDYSFNEYYNAQWLSLIRWTASPAFRVNETNHLEVFTEQGHFSLFVNGVWVADYDDQAISSGVCGLLVGMDDAEVSAAWEFDNFELRAVSTADEIHTPAATTQP
jgi:predicted small secreted protein